MCIEKIKETNVYITCTILTTLKLVWLAAEEKQHEIMKKCCKGSERSSHMGLASI